jgi:hypothetical protein
MKLGNVTITTKWKQNGQGSKLTGMKAWVTANIIDDLAFPTPGF